MRPPVGPNDDEQFASIEALLRDAAEFEAPEPVPGLLTAGGIALLLTEDAARRRRTVRARVALFAGVLTGAAACSASLVLALNQPKVQVEAHPVPTVQVAQQVSTAESSTRPVAETPAASSRRPVLLIRRSRKVRHRRSQPRSPVQPATSVWTEETVERRVTGILAQAWLVQPDGEGGVELTPALVDLTLEPAVACEVTPEPSQEPAAEAPAPPELKPELNLEENEAR